MKVVIACDHAGYEVKEIIKQHFKDRFEWIDVGTYGPDSVHYPDFGHQAAQAIQNDEAEKGILICGTGIGISMAANRHKGIRAALCANTTMARLARQHNDANIIAVGSRIIGIEAILDCIDTFMNTAFEGGRHQTRIDMIER